MVATSSKQAHPPASLRQATSVTPTIALGLMLFLSGCASMLPIDSTLPSLSEVFIKDFRSLEPEACTTADVALSHSDALAFFQRARTLSRAEVEDNYPTAPCFVEGTLRADGQLCDWRISAAATGFIHCDGATPHEWYFACDDCSDLLVK